MNTILKASTAAATLLVLSCGAASAAPCFVTGTSGDDTLVATPQMPPCTSYVMAGFAGDDTITGAGTPDKLSPGDTSALHFGHDTMTGGGGADIFFIDPVSSASLGANAQEITDFTHNVDQVSFHPLCNAAGVTCTFIGNAAFSGTPGEIRYTIGGGSTVGVLAVDLDGDSVADFEVALDGAPTVSGGDVVV